MSAGQAAVSLALLTRPGGDSLSRRQPALLHICLRRLPPRHCCSSFLIFSGNWMAGLRICAYNVSSSQHGRSVQVGERGDFCHVKKCFNGMYFNFLPAKFQSRLILLKKRWEIGKFSNAKAQVMGAFHQRIMVASELAWYSLEYPKLWKLCLLELVCLETLSILFFFFFFRLPKTEGERFS